MRGVRLVQAVSTPSDSNLIINTADDEVTAPVVGILIAETILYLMFYWTYLKVSLKSSLSL